MYKQRSYILTVITLILSAIIPAAANTEQLENFPTHDFLAEALEAKGDDYVKGICVRNLLTTHTGQ
jgi:hypothetical protein